MDFVPRQRGICAGRVGFVPAEWNVCLLSTCGIAHSASLLPLIFSQTQHSTIQKLSLKNALVRLSAVLAPKQSDDHTYTVGTCLLLVCFSIQSIFYRSKDGGDFVFHKPI